MKLSLKDKITGLGSSFKKNIFAIQQEKAIKVAIILSPVLCLFSLIFLIFAWRRLPPQVPLFYSLPWGKEQLANKLFLLILPLGSFFWGLLNFFLAIFSFEKYSLATKILLWETILISFLASMSLVKIILLIT